MSHRDTPSRSFNTVKHSNREKRKKRLLLERKIFLSILLVVLAIALTGTIFLVFTIADVVGSRTPNLPDDTTDSEDSATPPNNTDAQYTNTLTKANTDVYTGELLIVNNSHAYQFPTNDPNLKNIYENRLKYADIQNTYLVGQNTWKLNSTALDAFNQMMYKYFELEGDGSVCITSAYRTKQDQIDLHSSVQAGYSDHHTGYCVAIKQATANGNISLETDHWIYQNAHKYGFVVRYPDDKSEITGVSDYIHCFRYVGVAHATYMNANNLCMEEYVELLQKNYSSGAKLKIEGADGNRYEVYYVKASNEELTQITVPANYSYTISGDNIGGFIITVNLNAPNT